MTKNAPHKESQKSLAQRLKQDTAHIRTLQTFGATVEQIQDITRSGAHKIISTTFETGVNGKLLLVGTRPQSSYTGSEIYGKNLIVLTPYTSYEKGDFTKPVRKIGIVGGSKKL